MIEKEESEISDRDGVYDELDVDAGDEKAAAEDEEEEEEVRVSDDLECAEKDHKGWEARGGTALRVADLRERVEGVFA